LSHSISPPQLLSNKNRNERWKRLKEEVKKKDQKKEKIKAKEIL
jgi:hypothetical protein